VIEARARRNDALDFTRALDAYNNRSGSASMSSRIFASKVPRETTPTFSAYSGEVGR